MTMFMLWGEVLRRISDVYWLSYAGNIWLGILSIASSFMFINLLISLFFRKIFRLTTTISFILVVTLSAVAMINNYKPQTIIEHDIYSDKISEENDGFRIILVSEFHLMNNRRIEWLQNTISRINDLEPDMIIIAGDLIDEPFSEVKHLVSYFEPLNPEYGIFSVPGNHDYYSNLLSYVAFTEEAGMVNLMNDNRTITNDISIAGVTDRTAETSNLETPDVKRAMSDITKDKFIIFVSHQPLYYKEAEAMGADLILAGHTHKGQYPPLSILIGLFYRYPYGIYSLNQSSIYTTSGVFTWGPPMRLFSKNEIVVFNLYSKI